MASCSENPVSHSSVDKKKHLDSLFQKGKNLADEEDYEKAYLILNKAKDGYIEVQDSVSMVKCLVEMAIIQEYQSDFLGSIETSLFALKSAKNHKLENETYYKIYNNLGVNSTDLKNFSDAKIFYNKALEYSSDMLSKLKIQHNLAVVYFNEKDYQKAEQTEKKVLSELKKRNDTYYKVAIHHARYLSYLDSSYNPLPVFHKAIDYSKQSKNLWGLDACYYYVSEYYYHKNPDSSLAYAHKNYQVATKLKATNDRLDALEKIIELEKKPIRYFGIYTKLSDSLETSKNSAKNQFAMVRFESEKNLNDKLKLEKQMSDKNNQLIFASLFMVFSISGGTLLYRYRQKKVKDAAEQKIKEDRFLISKKVHDVVANGIYNVMSSIERHQDFNKEEILDKLDDMYQKSRDISHNKFHLYEGNNIREQISELAKTFQNEDLQVFVVGNDMETWSHVPVLLQHEIYPILLELFVNTRKHSIANRIVMKFESLDSIFKVTYSDNGVCVSDKLNKGMGLNSIEQRIIKNGGNIDFNNPNQNPGFFVKISFLIRN